MLPLRHVSTHLRSKTSPVGLADETWLLRRSASSVATCATETVTSTPMPEIAVMDTAATAPRISSHGDLQRYSVQEPAKFWGALARSRIRWKQEFQTVYQGNFSKGVNRWFVGGKLNVADNCLDRHVEKNPDKVALIWEKDEPGQEEKITYRELQSLTNKMANLLKKHGIQKGDRVAIYLTASPILVATMLACARIGAMHNVVFAGFSADALAQRINDASAKVLITNDQGIRGGRIIELKRTVDKAVANCPCIQQVFVYKRTGGNVPMGKKDVYLNEILEKEPDVCTTEAMDSEDHLFLLYTSGSTGKPKGVTHSQGGYLVYANVTFKHVFDYREGDIFGCAADIGWITGHSYVVYGPLSNGATSLLFESTPTYPNPGRYWEMVQRLKLTHFYGAPTAIRLLLGQGDDWVKKYDRSSLRILGSVGEPINSEAWRWYHDVVGEKRCTLVDTWWQTETGGICLSPLPASPNTKINEEGPHRPMFGINPVLLDQEGKLLTGNDVQGSLCLSTPWPGIAQTLYGDHNRFVDTYFKQYPGYYFSGDGASRDANGLYHISGRMDDVINVSGHRLGTAEIEDVLDKHPDVSETAVVGFPHKLKGEGIYAYIVLKSNVNKSKSAIIQDLKKIVKDKIASYAIPDRILLCPALPKTRSGKIMRRILRKVAADKPDELGDTSTLSEPQVVDVIIKAHERITGVDN